jgi:CRP-like cAMP-binding protein
VTLPGRRLSDEHLPAVEALRRTRLLQSLPPAALDALAVGAVRRHLVADEVLFAEGDPAPDVAVVAVGRLKVVLRVPDRGELLVRIAGPGATLGEPSLADGGPRSATVVALEPTSVLLLRREQLIELVRAHPEALDELLLVLAGLVRLLSSEYADLVFLDLPRRVAKLLLEESVGGRLDLGLSQTALAAMIGGSRQAVNAALGQLQRHGWIERRSGAIVLRDEAALRRFAGGLT